MKRIIYTLLSVMLSVGAWAQTSLQEQINNTTDGSTVQLTEDYTGQIVVPATSNLTLDLNGHKIEYTGTAATLINNGTLTIKDSQSSGKIVSTKYVGVAAGNNSTTTIESGIFESVESTVITGKSVGATITINGGTFSASDNAVIAGNGTARDGNANTITINNGTFNGQITSTGYVACGIYAPWKDVITVNGGTFNITNGAGIVARAGTVTVNGGTFNCTGTATGKVGDSRVVVPCSAIVYDSQANYPAQTAESKVVVPSTSTAVFKSQKGVAAVSVVGESHIEISGGTYSSPLTEDVCAEGYVPSNTPNADGTYGAKAGTYVAQIGDVKYASLAEAIAAATDGQTMTLLENITVTSPNAIEINKKLTIDFAGHTLTSTAEQPIHVLGSGDLTITGNGTIVGPTGEAGKALDGKTMITVEGGKLSYLSGTLTCGGIGSDGMYGVYILNGGTAVFGNESDKTGPTITSWFAAIGENNTTAPAYITVYGGSYTAKATPTDSDWWSYFCAPIYAAGSGKIDIYDGTFNGYYGLSSRYSNVDQDLNIHGGTFNGNKQALFFDNQSGVDSSASRDVAVSGGTFSSEVPEEYCANGFVPKDNGDGTYGVKEGTYVAQIGDAKYESLQEAISAVTSGQEITLLTDVTVEQTLLIDKNITINGGGHTITSTVTNKLGAFYVNTNNCIFTIQNATLEGNNVASMAVVSYRGVANSALDGIVETDTNNDGNNITLTNCKVQNFTGWPGSYVGAVYAFSHSHLTLNNCTFTGNTTSLSANGASGADVWTGAATTVVINGGTYNEVFVNTNSSNVETVTINGGATIEELAICVSYKEDGSTNIPHLTIDNATVNTLTTEEGNPIPAEGITLQNEGSITNKPATEVAKIYNGTKTKAFATFDDALTAVKNDETITILTDVTIATIDVVNGKTIDKNGHEVYVTSFVVTDGQAANIPFDFIATTATYTRNVAENVWGTVCVPFTLKSCDAYTLYTVGSIEGSTLNVNEVDGVVAPGTPVIFKKNSNDGTTITFTTENANIVKEGPATTGTLVGTYTSMKKEGTDLTNIYFINGDAFHQAKASLTVPAYRAYINYPGGGSAKPSILSILVGESNADGIEAVTTDAAITTIYDANGRQLSAPQKGMNIIKLTNGKTVKMMVK